MSVSDAVLNATEIIIDNAIQKAGYDRTIQGQIVSCEDATIGKYKCRYQDATFYAYTNNTDMSFSNGSYVYILVPNGNMNNEKTILGTTNKLGINYISQAVGDQAYNMIGSNCITTENVLYLNTNIPDYHQIIYSIDNDNNKIIIDTESLTQSIKQSSSIVIGATVKTSIDAQRQYKGHYGITYNLKFTDNTGNEVIRSYTIDEDNMVGNPYRLTYPTRQYEIFDVDGPNFVQIVSIQIFNRDFPNATGEGEADIELTKLQINGAVRMSESEVNGVAISFYTPQGLFFTETSDNTSYKTIIAQVRIRGKLASAAQKIPFYWGQEHVGITVRNEKYNKYLGRGWQCLNDSNLVIEGSEAIDPVVEWVPSGDTYMVEFNQNLPRDNRFKVAIVYDGNVISKQINIQNLKPSAPEVSLQSSNGTQFYFDNGQTTLSCVVKQQDKANEEKVIQNEDDLKDHSEDNEYEYKYTYSWGYIDNKGSFFQLDNDKPTYSVLIGDITAFRTFKCSVYENTNNDIIYVGTASIKITNTLQTEGLYHLVIENGDMVFQYNENGVAPTNGSVDSPQIILPLSFTLYDNMGFPISAQSILDSQDCSITWEFPIKDTLLIDNNGSKENIGEYRQYKDQITLGYNIANQYNIKKQRNQIKLTVDYKGMVVTAETAFTFVKQGEPGTNGTQYVVRIVPDVDNPPAYPMITKVENDEDSDYKFNFANVSTKPFQVQLWKSGELVWSGYSEQNGIVKDEDEKPTKVIWEILDNKLKKGSSLFIITNNSNGYELKINNENKFSSDSNDDNYLFKQQYANIIKCSITLKDKTYYGTLPIITAWVRSEDYSIELKDNTGFRYVIYTSDGINPSYNSSVPFEFVFKDTSNSSNNKEITYEVDSIGSLLKPIKSDYLRDGYESNQYNYQPAPKYDGESVIEAVTCTCKDINDDTVALLHIPIHFLLNKYGLSHLNDWDGNSIDINDQGGYILSPQMGAGKKNNNAFTGILMGEVRTPGKTNSDIGLLGYAEGARTFFLNSQNGSAIFGKAVTNKDKSGGQIIVDPSTQDALLYSSNYWNNYNESGLPNDYNKNNQTGSGLLINLSDAWIKYGNGKFYVTNQGHLHAAGGGDIAGWNLGDNELTGGDLHLVSSGHIYSNEHKELGNTNNGFYLSADGLSIGSKVKITKDGTAYFGKGAVDGKTNKYWTINSGQDSNKTSATKYDYAYISFGGKRWHDAYQNTTRDNNPTGTTGDPIADVYLGTNGISLGNNFSVNPNGSMTANHGIIGGWSIANKTLSGGNIELNSNGSLKGGNSYEWSISQNGEAKFNRLIADSSGSIAGWTIHESGLSSSTGNMKINKDGSISGGTNPNNSNLPGWSITSNGVATFANTFNVINNFSFTGSGSFGKGGGVGSGGGMGVKGGIPYCNGGISNGNGSTLSAQIITAAQAKFDQVYAKKAVLEDLSAIKGTINNLKAGTLAIPVPGHGNQSIGNLLAVLQNNIDALWRAVNGLNGN